MKSIFLWLALAILTAIPASALVYGPDRSGTYGGAQGIGGLEAVELAQWLNLANAGLALIAPEVEPEVVEAEIAEGVLDVGAEGADSALVGMDEVPVSVGGEVTQGGGGELIQGELDLGDAGAEAVGGKSGEAANEAAIGTSESERGALAPLAEDAGETSAGSQQLEFDFGASGSGAAPSAPSAPSAAEGGGANLSNLQSTFEGLADQHLLPQFRAIDPDLEAGYTGSFKTGVVGNPNKATFGQPVDLNNFDIDYYIKSDTLYQQYGNSLKANVGFRQILSDTPGFEGLKPNKAGFSIKFLPSSP